MLRRAAARLFLWSRNGAGFEFGRGLVVLIGVVVLLPELVFFPIIRKTETQRYPMASVKYISVGENAPSIQRFIRLFRPCLDVQRPLCFWGNKPESHIFFRINKRGWIRCPLPTNMSLYIKSRGASSVCKRDAGIAWRSMHVFDRQPCSLIQMSLIDIGLERFFRLFKRFCLHPFGSGVIEPVLSHLNVLQIKDSVSCVDLILCRLSSRVRSIGALLNGRESPPRSESGSEGSSSREESKNHNK